MSRTPETPKKPPLLNEAMLNRESWKIFQIMAEFVEGFERLSSVSPAVSIFGSSRTPEDHPQYQLTVDIARKLSDAGFSVISGGGPGIMEAANRGAQQGKSLSVGLNIELPREQKPNEYQDIELHFRHFFSRKVMFVKYASAYVVCPGGFGTLDELAEMLTLRQTGKTRSIPVVLVDKAYWQPLLDWFRNSLMAEGKIHDDDLDIFTLADTADEVVTAIFDHYEQRNLEPSAEEQEILLQL